MFYTIINFTILKTKYDLRVKDNRLANKLPKLYYIVY